MDIRRVEIGDQALAVVDKGRGAPVLLVHGFPLDHSMWSGQIDSLSDRFRVIAPDLRGFGASGVAEGIATMEGFADDLARLLDALQIDRPATFVGLSMGGYIAWQFWRRHPERLDRLVLCDTRALPDSEDTARGRLLTAERVLVQGPSVIAEPMIERLFAPATRAAAAGVAGAGVAGGRGAADCVESVRRVILSTSPLSIAAALRGMAQRVDASPWLPLIDLPTLVVCGEHDGISPPSEMRSLAESMRQATFVQLDGVGHMAPLESPAEFNARLTEWLAGTRGR